MLNALKVFGQAVYNHDHLDIPMKDLIAFIDKYEWSCVNSKLCKWSSTTELGPTTFLLEAEICKYPEQGAYTASRNAYTASRNEPFKLKDGYYNLSFNLDMQYGEVEHPLMQKWKKHFGCINEHQLFYDVDFESAKRIITDIYAFLCDPLKYGNEDEEPQEVVSLEDSGLDEYGSVEEKNDPGYLYGYYPEDDNEEYIYRDGSIPQSLDDILNNKG